MNFMYDNHSSVQALQTTTTSATPNPVYTCPVQVHIDVGFRVSEFGHPRQREDVAFAEVVPYSIIASEGLLVGFRVYQVVDRRSDCVCIHFGPSVYFVAEVRIPRGGASNWHKWERIPIPSQTPLSRVSPAWGHNTQTT